MNVLPDERQELLLQALVLLVLVLVSGPRYGGVYVMFCTRVGVAKQMAKLLNVIASDVQCACVCVSVSKQANTHTLVEKTQHTCWH